MTLTAPRFAGDPILEACLAGAHRMLAPELGPAVRKIQEALIDLGFALPSGADSKFGTETGLAVSGFKTSRGIFPNDPVVGVKTMNALDNECADKPPPPFSERDEWISWRDRAAIHPTIGAFNFTRADEFNRRKFGVDFSFDAASQWLPSSVRDTIAQSLPALLDPTGSPAGVGAPAATWGAGPFDLFHCHLAILTGGASSSVPLQDGQRALSAHLDKLRNDSATAPEAVKFNQAWAAAHRVNLLSSGVLDQARELASAAITSATVSNPALLVWHTYEMERWRPPTMNSTSPQRHWQTILAPARSVTVYPFPFVTPNQYFAAVQEIFEIHFVISKSAVITASPGIHHDVYALANLVPDDVDAIM